MKKSLLIAIAAVVALACVIGTTLAVVFDTKSITNTFVIGNVDVELTETEGGDSHEFKVIPGSDIDKTAVVTVAEGSDPCYLFVKLTPSENFPAFLSYDIDATEGWKALEDSDGVYYISGEKSDLVDASEAEASFHVLDGDKISVNSDLMTKDAVDELETAPTLDIAVFAVAADGIATVADAWAACSAE